MSLISDINHIGPNPPMRNESHTPKYIIATGGTETTDGNYKIHTFDTPGAHQLQVQQVGDIPYFDEDEGTGGGGGGGGRGGGAGGRTVRTTLRPAAVGIYNITVGDGGLGATDTFTPGPVSNGQDSTFDGTTAKGGGHGGTASDTASIRNGSTPGGGGAVSTAGTISGIGAPNGGSGGKGGDGCNMNGCGFRGGGGGGDQDGISGLAAVNPSYGGDGFQTSIRGFPEKVGPGGGGGGGAGGASGGNDGGGAGTVGSSNPPGNGQDGMGAGGGSSESKGGGKGGCGRWVVRYRYK